MNNEALIHSLHNKLAEPQHRGALIATVVQEGFPYRAVASSVVHLVQSHDIYDRVDGKVENGIDGSGNDHTRQLPLPGFDDYEQHMRGSRLESHIQRRQAVVFKATQASTE